jgi:predicted phosphodiesterase
LTHSYELLDETHRKNYGEWLDFFNNIKPLRDEQVKDDKIDIVICGHTHQPKIFKIKNLTIINPGSIAKSRDANGQSYAIGTIKDNDIHFSIKYYKPA